MMMAGILAVKMDLRMNMTIAALVALMVSMMAMMSFLDCIVCWNRNV